QSGAPLSLGPAIGLLQASKSPASVSLDFLRRNTPQKTAKAKVAVSTTLSLSVLTRWLKSPYAIASAVVVIALLFLGAFASSAILNSERQRLTQMVATVSDVGWNLKDKPQAELDQLQASIDSHLGVLRPLMDEPISVAAKLDALAKTLPEGVWLTSLSWEHRLSSDVQSSLQLSLQGACYLGEMEKEVAAIQEFERQVKHNTIFFKGLTSVRLGQINTLDVPSGSTLYRVFQLSCQSS
ncbi:MAG: PilN domain-containing protein, partial [Candidatus Omnitrophica bacterium]|nr:PilN domain-containing protein [Candidatus Omnitrophota bacterium]